MPLRVRTPAPPPAPAAQPSPATSPRSVASPEIAQPCKRWAKQPTTPPPPPPLQPEAQQGWRGDEAAPHAALIVFSGPGERRDGIAAYLHHCGWRVVEIDILIGGSSHDMACPMVATELAQRVASGEFAVVFLAPPCSSYSVAHRPKLRSASQPEGITPVPAEWRMYLAKHNRITSAAFDIVAAARLSGAHVMMENPADRGTEGPAYWHKHRDHGSLWRTARARAAELTQITFSQCALGSTWQKHTTIAASPTLADSMTVLSAMQCAHGHGRHPAQAHGRDASGASQASKAAAYPTAMNAYIAAAIIVAGVTRRAAWPPSLLQQPNPRAPFSTELPQLTANAVHARRYAPLRFASTANRIPASLREERASPFPNQLAGVMHTSASRRALKKGRRLPPPPRFPTSAEPTSRPAPQEVHVRDLFLLGVYDEYVTPWLAEATRAAELLMKGARPPKIATVVLPQAALRPFARGTVWQCLDPERCSPVQPSDRHTIFPGRRQIDRAAMRAIAAELGWDDDDIIQQIGEGGIETRSECQLSTVLSWHHTGFHRQLAAARHVIDGEIQDEWVSEPLASLPFVPCRVLPRNVVMQQRTRKRADGTIEQYQKPRISTDCSDGAEESVNGGVPPHERDIELPSVQQFGRAVAMVDAAGTTPADEAAGEAPTRAEMYIVDATAAYRFCPLNITQLYTQVFAYWTIGDEGIKVGFCVDRRMMFGGSYAPNRFERISRLIGAYIQLQQRRFDERQPPPPCAQRWQRMRRGRQLAGLLELHPAEAEPRSLQVFIDDWMGSSLNDTVTLEPALAALDIAPSATTNVGGIPSAPSSRTRAHACIAILGLRTAGLEAAEDKTLLGTPVVALGIRADRKRKLLDIPTSKGEAVAAELQTAQEAAQGPQPSARREAVEQLTGRLCHLAQVSPEIAPALRGGYSLIHAPSRHTSLAMRRGSTGHRQWIELLSTAARAVRENLGVCLSPRRAFPSPDSVGTATAFSDASGDDGVGGYLTLSDEPGTVWVVSQTWPADIATALARSAQGTRGQNSLAMPAAELFGMWAIPVAARTRGMSATSVIAVGDCQPAVARLTVPHGGSADGSTQMRALAVLARASIPDMLAVHIPRELNTISDDLSHPARLPSVLESIAAAGLAAVVCQIPEECWTELRKLAVVGTNRSTAKASADKHSASSTSAMAMPSGHTAAPAPPATPTPLTVSAPSMVVRNR